jgi:hypothetical protein
MLAQLATMGNVNHLLDINHNVECVDHKIMEIKLIMLFVLLEENHRIIYIVCFLLFSCIGNLVKYINLLIMDLKVIIMGLRVKVMDYCH